MLLPLEEPLGVMPPAHPVSEIRGDEGHSRSPMTLFSSFDFPALQKNRKINDSRLKKSIVLNTEKCWFNDIRYLCHHYFIRELPLHVDCERLYLMTNGDRSVNQVVGKCRHLADFLLGLSWSKPMGILYWFSIRHFYNTGI